MVLFADVVSVVVWELIAGVWTNWEEKRLFPNSFGLGLDDLVGCPRNIPARGQMTSWESLSGKINLAIQCFSTAGNITFNP